MSGLRTAVVAAVALAALAGLSACGGRVGGAQPTPSPGGEPPDGNWRPFSADSPWNTKIPANAAIDPNSDSLVADFASSGNPDWAGYLGVNIGGYSIPLYWAGDATISYPLVAEVIGGIGWTGAPGKDVWDRSDATAMVPIPDGAVPDPESDHHFLIVDRQRVIEWGCWDTRHEAGGWRASVCATADLTGTGVRVPVNEAANWWEAHGARACGFPLIAGLIRREEIEAGEINHALVVAYPGIRADYYSPPASTAQGPNGTATPEHGIPCGGRIQFDPAVDLDTLGLSRTGRIIVKALQDYGAFVGDFSGSRSLYAENSAGAQAYWADGALSEDELFFFQETSPGTWEVQSRIDLSRLRVLAIGPMYDARLAQ